jgi:hypothetical protein
VVKPFVVHEWGTFTSVSNSDGTFLPFYVNSENDLPKFVYSARAGITLVKQAFYARTSMETPVLYFYTDEPRTVSVNVDFALRDTSPRPQAIHADDFEELRQLGESRMTEWYPAATNSMSRLGWPKVQLVPGAQPKLPVEQAANHYYEARDVDAVPVRVETLDKGKPVTQHEKFLFYRGVSRGVASPLQVKVNSKGQFVIHNKGKEQADALVLLQVKGDKISLLEAGSLESGKATTVTGAFQPSTPEAVTETLVQGLVKNGLYPKEAKAMVATWRKAWFGDEGTRLLYLLPTATTDRLLPLKIEPRPDTIVRVLVGRIDIVTPDVEKALDAVTQRIVRAQEAIDQAATDEAKIALQPAREREYKALEPFQKQLGRYYGPAVEDSFARQSRRAAQ